MDIYVGNLAYAVTEDDLRVAFSAHGQVASARVTMDRETGRSKGFGFVEMPNTTEAQTAIDSLNGKDLKGRNATVNQAKPREDRGNRGRSTGPQY